MTSKTDLGMVQIHNEVIGSIAAAAAREVRGVLDVWAGPFSHLKSRLGYSNVRVDVQDQEVRVWVTLVAEYGVNLPDMALQVQERIREMVDRMTHLPTAEVHVGIHHVAQKEKGGSR